MRRHSLIDERESCIPFPQHSCIVAEDGGACIAAARSLVKHTPSFTGLLVEGAPHQCVVHVQGGANVQASATAIAQGVQQGNATGRLSALHRLGFNLEGTLPVVCVHSRPEKPV